jgi:ABC-type uncharacterized transport system permease subunit
MNSILIGSFTILTYLGSTFLIFKELIDNRPFRLLLFLPWLAVITHSLYMTSRLIQPDGINLSFFNTASLVALIVVLILQVAAFTKPVRKLGIAIYPIAAITLTLEMTVPIKAQILQHQSIQMDIHVMASIIAFSLLNIAALQAILLAIQEQQLRKHPPKKFIQSLPALETMESLLFQMIAVGIIFLSVSLISGFIFIEDLFAQHLVHKTFLSIIAWITFSALLLGRMRYGWRGQTAVKLTLSGFTLLLLAYFGSKLVLELILNR